MMKSINAPDRWEFLRKSGEYVQEMKALGVLHDKAPRAQKNEMFDRMTDLRNKAMEMLEMAHGRRFKPIRIKLSPKRAV